MWNFNNIPIDMRNDLKLAILNSDYRALDKITTEYNVGKDLCSSCHGNARRGQLLAWYNNLRLQRPDFFKGQNLEDDYEFAENLS